MGKEVKRERQGAEHPDKAAVKPAKPERSEKELDRMRSAHNRNEGRHSPVSVQVDTNEDGSISLSAPHDDARGWIIRMQDAFGSASEEFAMGQLRHLVGVIPPEHTAPRFALNSMLAAADGVRPENEIEGALAVQMAATHQLAMQCLSKAACATTLEQRESAGNLATKMLRTYTTQIEALAKLRRGGEQTMRVEHVHVYAGGQAIVGSLGQGVGGSFGNPGQPHALTGPATYALSDGGAVLRQDAQRVGVPVASGERQNAVPNARRSKGKRRAQG